VEVTFSEAMSDPLPISPYEELLIQDPVYKSPRKILLGYSCIRGKQPPGIRSIYKKVAKRPIPRCPSTCHSKGAIALGSGHLSPGPMKKGGIRDMTRRALLLLTAMAAALTLGVGRPGR
jgi:hypothetical protein